MLIFKILDKLIPTFAISEKVGEDKESAEKKEEEELKKQVESYLKRHDYQQTERWGKWIDTEKGQKLQELLEKIQNRLYKVFQIPQGKFIAYDSPEINAYVVKTKPDIYMNSGLLSTFQRWCVNNNVELTEDKIAFIVAHEMTHIEQGTEEEYGSKEKLGGSTTEKRDKRQESKNNEYDADKTAIIRMANAGYNPKEGIETLEFLQSLGEGLPFFSTHPRSADRTREIQELVNDIDSYIPNIEHPPANLSAEIIESLSSDTLSHPGTRLYRKEVLTEIEDLIGNASNVHDLLEIGGVALTLDEKLLARQEIKNKKWNELMAKKIAINNLQKIIHKAVEINTDWSSNLRAKVQRPYKEDIDDKSLYYYREFEDFNDFPQLKYDSKNILGKKEEDLEEKLEKTIKTINKIIADFEERIVKEFKFLPEEKEKLGRILSWLRPLAENNAELLRNMIGSMNSESLEAIVNNAEIYEEDDSKEKRMSEIIENMSAEKILKLCMTDGSLWFSELFRSKNIDLSQETKGIASLDSFYEPYLSGELTDYPQLKTPEGRKELVDIFMFQRISSSIRQEMATVIEESEGLNKEAKPTSIPSLFLAGIMPEINERIDLELKKIGIKNPQRIAKYLVNYSINIVASGYNPQELNEAVEEMDLEDCTKLFDFCNRPFVEEKKSANQLFTSETNIRPGGIGQIFAIINTKIAEAAEQRIIKLKAGDTRKTPVEEYQALLEYCEKSDPEMLDHYFEKIISSMLKLDIRSAEELNKYAVPFIQLPSRWSRDKFIGKITNAFEERLELTELLKFLKGKGIKVIANFHKRNWEDSTKREKMSNDEQLKYMRALIDVIPNRDVDRSSGIDEEKYEELSFEYFQLWKKSNPDKSPKDTVKFILLKGKLDRYTKGNDKGAKKGKYPEFEEAINQLNEEDILELADFFAENKNEDITFTRGYLTDIKYAAIMYRNGIKPTQIFNLSEEITFNTEIPIAENLRIIKQYNAADYIFKKCIGAYGIGAYNYRKLVETADENPDAIFPEGYINIIEKLRENSTSHERIELPWDIEGSAERYDPNANKIFQDLFKREAPMRRHKIEILESYFHKFGIISGIPTTSIASIREKVREAFEEITEAKAVEKPIDTLSDRAKRVVELIKEETDYKDLLFSQMEESILSIYGLTTEGHRLIPSKEFTKEQIQQMLEFYKFTIPLIVDLEQKELWGRRAHSLYKEHIFNEETRFNEALSEILEVFPVASYGRDNALKDLADQNLLKTQEQAKEIHGLFFINQKRTSKEKETKQQKKIEQFNEIISKISRNEKKDFILWVIGSKKEPPLTFRAVGGRNECSMEDIPAFIFAANPQERNELFMRMLYGGNGILDPKNAEDEEIFRELVESSFLKIFPEDEIEGKGREIVKTIFTSILEKYSPYRRSKIYIEMLETLMSGEKDMPIEKRITSLLVLLGPVFVKAAQVLSEEETETGEPLLPEKLREEFSKLKKDVKPFHRIGAFQVMESVGEFDESKADRILEIEDQLAAASIKVVYKLKDAKGKTEVIKVRRPSIGKNLEEDFQVLGEIVNGLSSIEGISVPQGFSPTIQEWIREEVDFNLEVQNHEKVAKVLDEFQRIRGDELLPEINVRTANVNSNNSECIREEFVNGITLEDLLDVDRGRLSMIEVLGKYFDENSPNFPKIQEKYEEHLKNIDKFRLLAFESLVYQIFQGKSLHADMHAGNMFITPEDELVLIDLGNIGEIDDSKINDLKKFFYGFLFASEKLGSVVNEVLYHSLIKESVETFVDDSEAAEGVLNEKLKKVEEIIVDNGIERKKKFQMILDILSSDGLKLDKGFKKFIKALVTANYLIKDIEKEAFKSILKHAALSF